MFSAARQLGPQAGKTCLTVFGIVLEVRDGGLSTRVVTLIAPVKVGNI